MRVLHDIETIKHPDADRWMKPVAAAKNLKDPAKIAEDIARRTAERKPGIDWHTGRIVCVGWWFEDAPSPTVLVCPTEAEEAKALTAFWLETARVQAYVGYKNRVFDLPYQMRRAQLLNVPHRKVSLAKYRREPVCDLYDEVTFDGVRAWDDACMEQTLKAVCARFGVSVPDDDGDGAQVQEWAAAGNWDAIAAHCLRDLERTKLLAERLGVWTPQPQPQEAQVF